MSLEGVILSFVGEKWKNLPFLGRTAIQYQYWYQKRGYWYPLDRGKVVPVPKFGGTGTHWSEAKWYRYQKLTVPVPIHQ